MKKVLASIVSVSFILVTAIVYLSLIIDNITDVTAMIEISAAFMIALIIQAALPFLSFTIHKHYKTTLSYFLPPIVVVVILVPICFILLFAISTWDALYFGLLAIVLTMGSIQSVSAYFILVDPSNNVPT